MSTGWSIFVILLVVVNLVGCAWLLFANRNVKIQAQDKGRGTGHDFDGIEELNNPLPAWWTWLFIATLVFGVAYFILYPGMGNFAGLLGWTSSNQHQAEVGRADEKYGPIFAGYFAMPVEDLLEEERALSMGSRIFANNCATCHGSDARGGKGFPNLTDGDWLWGGDPETIKQTITNGRMGLMVPFGDVLGDDETIGDVVEYVLSLSGRDHDAARAAKGETQFAAICSACHLASGEGLQALGAPNLTDDVWLHGGRRSDIDHAIRKGLDNRMPAHDAFLNPEQIHLVTAYVYSLSGGER